MAVHVGYASFPFEIFESNASTQAHAIVHPHSFCPPAYYGSFVPFMSLGLQCFADLKAPRRLFGRVVSLCACVYCWSRWMLPALHADLSDCERAAGTPSEYYGPFHCAAEKNGRVTCKQNHSVWRRQDCLSLCDKNLSIFLLTTFDFFFLFFLFLKSLREAMR